MFFRVERLSVRGKKILLLVNGLVGGGAERVTLNLAEDWSRQGAEVVLATLVGRDRDEYPVAAGVRRIALDIAGTKSVFSLLRNHIAPVLALRRMLRTEKPDIAVGMMTISAVGLAMTRSRDCIAVGVEHNHPPLAYQRSIWGILRRSLYARLDAVVALTEESAEWLRVHTKSRRVAVIPNSVSLPLPENTPHLAVADVVAPGRKFLLAVGRFDEVKAFDRLLDGFAQTAGRHGDWDLVILGDGEMRGALEAQVARLNLTGRVHLPGFVGNVAEWYDAADAFALTSLQEGFGMVLIEAMAHGCAVLSVDCDVGPREIIRDGEDGLLISQDDPTALAEGLDRLLGDAALRERLASRAGEVLTRFSPERIRGMWESLFDELEAGRR